MERFVEVPNLPRGNVSLAVVDRRVPQEIENTLKKMNIKILKTKKISDTYDAISCHPDIMLHHIGGQDIIAAPNINHEIVYSLEDEGCNIISGKSIVSSKYPYDIPYNAARVGNYVLCNIKYTDEILLNHLYKRGVEVIDIKQGYAKCSICVVSHDAVITSDRGIHNILKGYPIESLLITPGHINLFNMNYGFIGGSSGSLSGEKTAFYGNLNMHPDFPLIHDFMLKHGKKVINLSENIMVDLGTLIPLKEYSILMQ